MGRKFGFSFSWKRAVGISGAKARISRKIGIPLTRSGRERKLGRMTTGGKCFVATVCCGDVGHPTVVTLRSFRDDVLCQHPVGRRFVAWYYRRGPVLAEILRSRPALRLSARFLLAGIAAALRGVGRRGWRTVMVTESRAQCS